MYFILELEFLSPQGYITSLIKSYAKYLKIEVEIFQESGKILVSIRDNQNIEEFLKGLEKILPASIFLKSAKHHLSETRPNLKEFQTPKVPNSIALCPNCQKEMFDINSPRYYYPFTSCSSCGNGNIFLEKYPFKRENSSIRYIKPCPNCESELKSNPFRENYPLISCLDCAIPVKMSDKKGNIRYANDKESFKRLFEVIAKAIYDKKEVVIKSLNGYRKLFRENKKYKESKILFLSANKLNDYFTIIEQEFNALLSIERPILKLSIKGEELKESYGDIALVKYPDEGFTILLAKELLDLGLDYISYIDCESRESGDYIVDFDINTTFQSDLKLFVNRDIQTIVSGKRVSFPMEVESRRVVLANGLISSDGIIDEVERFKKIEGDRLYILEDEEFNSNVDEVRFSLPHSLMASVLAQNSSFGKKAIGVHFDTHLYFLYYNEKNIITVIPPNLFNPKELFENISTLREGSDRLVKNFETKFPKIYRELLELKETSSIFEVVAIILELEEKSLESLLNRALEFMGKGGIKIDMNIRDNRFDNYAFLASIMSYKIAGADESLIAFSIFESFGDYISDILTKLLLKTKANSVTITGETFANQALFGKVEKALARREILLPKYLPIGRESAVFGGLFL